MWTHRDLVEGSFTFHDLIDAHEYLDTKNENLANAKRWAKAVYGE